MMQKSANIFQSSNHKKPAPRFQVSDNVVEQVRGMGTGVAQSFKRDLIGGMGKTAMNSLFNPGLLRPAENRPFSEFPMRREQFGPKKIEKPREFFVYTAKEAQMQKKIEEVRYELKLIIAQLKNVDKEVVKAVNAPIPESGTYYLNFLDRLKAILHVLRKELEQGGTWMQMMQGRKKHKGYWAMYKKKGTSFGLSSERFAATQTG